MWFVNSMNLVSLCLLSSAGYFSKDDSPHYRNALANCAGMKRYSCSIIVGRTKWSSQSLRIISQKQPSRSFILGSQVNQTSGWLLLRYDVKSLGRQLGSTDDQAEWVGNKLRKRAPPYNFLHCYLARVKARERKCAPVLYTNTASPSCNCLAASIFPTWCPIPHDFAESNMFDNFLRRIGFRSAPCCFARSPRTLHFIQE
jgi:hypothetical protein